MAKLSSNPEVTNSTPLNAFQRLQLKYGGYVPSSSSDTNGEIGEFSFDDGYIYVKVGAASWGRSTLTTGY